MLATRTLDQSTNGDQWHAIAEGLRLDPAARPRVRVRAGDGRTLLADALHVFSAQRYNDGSPATHVTLEPMDGIVLRRAQPTSNPISQPRRGDSP
ncbi:MAG: carbohydrate-binding protein [Thermoguttaceae bacterium]